MKIFLFFCWLLLTISCRENKAGGKSGLPSFDLLLDDGRTHFNTCEIKPGKPVALLYFSPDCEHCQQETKFILRHMDSLREVHFYFITNDSLDRLMLFKSVFQLNRYSNITLGWDTRFLFASHFKGAYPPYLVLYDRQLRQIGTLNGEFEARKLIDLISNR